MTAKALHRERAFKRWGNRCHIHGSATSKCDGRLQACHFIAAQRLREARRGANLSAHRFKPDDPRMRLLDFTPDELVADARNSIILCYGLHEAFDGKRADRLVIPPPACVVEFATYFGLEHHLQAEAA